MSATSISSSVYTSYPTSLSLDSKGKLNEKSIEKGSKCRPLAFVFGILGLVGLIICAYKIIETGMQNGWSSVIYKTSEADFLISMVLGILGCAGLIYGTTSLKDREKIPFSSQPQGPAKNNNQPKEDTWDKKSELLLSAFGTPSKKTLGEDNNATENLTNYKAQICITSDTKGGYIGSSATSKLLPDYLKSITLVDGSPLPLAPEDRFIHFKLFEPSAELMTTSIPLNLFLPASIFKGKEDGDLLELKYDNILIQFTLNQSSHGMKYYTEGNFKDVFNSQARYVTLTDNKFSSFFSKNTHIPPFYTLGKEGCIYKFTEGESDEIFSLRQGTSKDFRNDIHPNAVKGDILVSSDIESCWIIMDFPSFRPEDFDIILNETHFIIYAGYKNRKITSEAEPSDLKMDKDEAIDSLDISDIFSEDDEEENESDKPFERTREMMYALEWNKTHYFKDCTVCEMKEILTRTHISLADGVLQLEMPLI